MFDAIVLSVAEGSPCSPRVPVLACADALRDAGARVETVVATSDADIDEVIQRFDAGARSDGLTWPDADSKLRLVVASAADGQLRAVVRRRTFRRSPSYRSTPARRRTWRRNCICRVRPRLSRRPC
jgi:FixJ family two-component response regulator